MTFFPLSHLGECLCVILNCSLWMQDLFHIFILIILFFRNIFVELCVVFSLSVRLDRRQKISWTRIVIIFQINPTSKKLCSCSSVDVMNLREIFQLAIVSSFLWVKIILVQSFKTVRCSHEYTSGVSTAYCDINWDSKDPNWGHNYPLIPADLPISLQVIYIRPKDDNHFNAVFLWPDTFKRYPQIQRIINQKNSQMRLTRLPARKAEMQENFTKIFSSLYSLEYLEISDSLYEDWLIVHLPPQLKNLNFDSNRYQKLDVHWATDLEELSVQNNSLLNIPKVAPVPSPPALKILRLVGNPLDDMTVVDIAQLCNLELLELNFPTSSLYVKEPGYCKCIMLKKWANETELKGLEKVNCIDPANKSNCSEQILEEARRIRNKCPLLKRGKTSGKIIQAMKYTFMFIILSLLLAALVLYLIRHFHLREYWAAHHLKMSQATSIKMEEGEEEMKSEGSEESSIKG